MLPRLTVLFSWTFCLLFFCATDADSQGTGQTYILSAPGDPTPDGQDTIELPNSFALSNTGAVFSAQLHTASVQAVFSATTAGKQEIVRVGNSVPGAGTITGLTGNLWGNNHGQALVYALTNDANNVSHDALVTGSAPSNLKTIVVSDQTIPDGNGQFNSFSAGTLNDAGDVGFWGAIKNGGGPLITTNGIFIGHPDGTVTEIARSMQNAPGETNPFYSMDSIALINPAGQVGFSGEINDSHFSSGSSSYGIYRASSSADIVKIARSYEPAAGTHYLFGWLQLRSMNNLGVASFYAYLIDGTGTQQGTGLFKAANSNAVSAIAYTGQSAPDSLGTYTAFDNTFSVNNAGQSAYVGYYEKGSTTSSGVFIGDGVTQRTLVLENQTAPSGKKYSGFALARANDTGTVAFTAQLNDSSTYDGIYLTDGVDTLKVAEVGDVVNGVTLSGLGFDPKAFNDFRQIAYQGQSGNGSSFEILLFAPDLKWRSNGDGHWEDAVNWTASLVPASLNNVNLAPPNGGKIAGPLADTTVKSLMIGATTSGTANLALAAGQLTVTNNLTVATLGKLSGNGRIIGSVINQGVVAPGSPAGSVMVQGSFTQLAAGTLEINIGEPASSTYGNLTVTANATLAGALKVITISNALDQLAPADALTVVSTVGTLTGTFSNAPEGSRLTTADGLASFQVNYTSHAVTLSNFAAIDSDADGIADYWTLKYFGHATGRSDDRSGANDDADGDGISNLAEYLAGTSPTDATNAFRAVASVNQEGRSITFTSASGRSYAIERSADLSAGSWAPVVSGIAGDGTSKTVLLDAPAPGVLRDFYRVTASR